MSGTEIKLMITDFDGTLVDTFEANFMAYQQAFADNGLELSEEDYHRCFGLRFEKFMDAMGIENADIRHSIRELKAKYYPKYFDRLNVNTPLLSFIDAFHRQGGKTAIASTARRKNLEAALDHIGARSAFDLILAGEEVKQGKPSPEIYLTTLQHFGIQPSEAIVFEDSDVGMQSAEAAGIAYIRVTRISQIYTDTDV